LILESETSGSAELIKQAVSAM